MKKILAVAILVLAVMVSACGAEESAKRSNPADDISTLCNAVLHFDDNSLKKIGLTREEYEQTFLGEFSKSFVDSSGVGFSDEQIAKVNNSVIAALERSPFKTETISENGDKATVKITVSPFEKFNESLLAEKLPANFDEMSETEKIDAVANAMAEVFKDLKTTEDKEITMECQYDAESQMWLPVKLEDFSVTIISNVLIF